MTKKVKFKKKRSHSNHLTALRGKNPLWKIPRIRLQFLVTLLLSFMLAVGGFSLTWHMMPCAWKIARHIPGMDLNREALKTELTERAKNYDLPSSENNKQEQAAFKPFFDCLDSYTGIAIYSGSEHYIRTQHTADIVHSKNWKKVQDIGILKDHILQMSGGDLNQPIASMGNDELGVLARELDQMRSTLYTNIQQEVESRRANQDLITAMSHDLRTPLTILHGYLDILALGRNPEQQSEYVRRCLQKTEDIQQLTDRMFEYSLVYEPPQSPLLVPIPLKNVQHMLSEHLDFLRLAGFQTSETIAPLYRQIEGDETSLKRLFQNLFSNVLKYGDKSEPVTLQISQKNDIFQIILSNAVKKDLTGIESNRIGLKSAEKIAKMHHGTLTFTQKDKTLFLVEVTFPLP